MQVPVGAEVVHAPREHLVPGGLVSHVPHNAVIGGVEYVVQGNGEFHHAQTACKVSGVVCQRVYDGLAQFLAHLWQCLAGQPAQVGGQMNALEQ